MVKIDLTPIEEFIAENKLTYSTFCWYCHISASTLRKIRKGQYVRLSTAVSISLNMMCPLSRLVVAVRRE